MGRAWKVLPVSLLISGLLPGQASAATSATISSATVDGTSVAVTGTSTFDPQPFTVLGTDATGDAPQGVGQNGGDLTAAAIATTLGGQVQLRWTMAFVAPVLNTSPVITYAWTFCVGEESCFELDMSRALTNPQSANVVGTLYRCGDPTCDPGGQISAATGVTGTFAAPGTITATLPTDVGVAPGATVTPVSLDVGGPVYTMVGTASPFTALYDTGDGVPEIADFTVASRQVSLAVAAPGQDPASVTYATTVTPAVSGEFSGSVDVAGTPPGDYTVYARACFGSNNCGYATSPVTIA